MKNLKLVLLILLNTPHKQTDAGTLWLSDNFHMPHLPKKIESRLKRAIDSSLAVDVLLRDKVSELSKAGGDTYLSAAMEHMDTPSLLILLGKLKEEYATKAKKEDADEVRSSFDKLTANLVTLSTAPRHSESGPAEILGQLSEEELEDESAMYGDEYYSEDEYSEEEDSSNPSLLALQSWNRKLSGASVWDW